MLVAPGTIRCLYGGIYDKIKFVQANLDYYDNESIRIYLKEIEEALLFYKTHCILSYVHLEEKYAELTQVIETWRESQVILKG